MNSRLLHSITRLPGAMRRRLLTSLVALPASALPSIALPTRDARAAATVKRQPDFATVRRGVPLQFPRDFGAHPEYRTEWWYITGWLQSSTGIAGTAATPARDAGPDDALGFQITFFRSRPAIDPRNPSRFAARQLVLAHVAVSDAQRRTLVHEQRSAREGFGLAGASSDDTDTWIGDWRLSRTGASIPSGVPSGIPSGIPSVTPSVTPSVIPSVIPSGTPPGTASDGGGSRYRADIRGDRLGMQLTLDSTQPLLRHGDAGFSRKGPLEQQASFYYTQPQLSVNGRVVVDARAREVSGRAWLDHEWSSEILAAGATGWDWIGINLDDGGALMAFRIRDRDGDTLWAGGSWRNAAGRLHIFEPSAIRFTPLRRWRSARTGATYPVAMRVELPDPSAASGARATIELTPMFDDQELDARGSTGIVYWEGAVTAHRGAATIGRGYLELTGYHGRLSL